MMQLSTTIVNVIFMILSVPSLAVIWSGYTHMVSSAWSDISEHFYYLGKAMHWFVLESLCFMNSFCNNVNYNANKYLPLHVCLKVNPFMSIHMYLTTSKDTIIYFWGFNFVSCTTMVILVLGQLIKIPHLRGRPSVSLFLWSNITEFFYISFFPTLNPQPLEYCFISQRTLFQL